MYKVCSLYYAKQNTNIQEETELPKIVEPVIELKDEPVIEPTIEDQDLKKKKRPYKKKYKTIKIF